MRQVLQIIIINTYFLYIPITVFFFGINNSNKRFTRPTAVFDRIQLTGFYIQDLVISDIYIYEIVSTFKLISTIRSRNSCSAIIHLFQINILIVLLDILLLLAEFKLHYIQVSLKTIVYSIKLKLEFSILNYLSLVVLLYTCKCGYTEQGQSSDQNIFNSRLLQLTIGPEIVLQLTVAPEEISRYYLLPGCLYSYQATLQELSSESIISTRDITYSETLPYSHLSIYPTRSSESLPILELSLSKFSLKFNV